MPESWQPGRVDLAAGPRAPADSAIQWRAGDLLEIVPHQAPARIREWLQRHHLDGQVRVAVEGVEQSLEQALAGACCRILSNTWSACTRRRCWMR